jgi:uncharacterized membrane protein
MAAAIVRAVVRVSVAEDFETLKLLTIFSLGGLVNSVLAARNGLDMSWAFF